MFYRHKDTGKKVLVYRGINVSFAGLLQLKEFLSQFGIKFKIRRPGRLDSRGMFFIEIETRGITVECWDGGVLILHSYLAVECATEKKLQCDYEEFNYFKGE